MKGVDQVKLANAKLQSEPGTAALKLMDCVFTTEEMVNSNPSGVTKSKDPTRQKTITALDPMKMKYIDGMHFQFTNQKFQYYYFIHRFSSTEMGCQYYGQGDKKKNDSEMHRLLYKPSF